MEAELTAQGLRFQNYCEQVREIRRRLADRSGRGIFTEEDKRRQWQADRLEMVVIPKFVEEMQMRGAAAATTPAVS